MQKRSGEFHFVRVTDKKTAATIKAGTSPEAIFLDGEGDEIHRASFTDGPTLEQAMTGAVKRNSPRAPAWATVDAGKGVPSAEEARRPLVLVFADDKKDSEETLKALEDRSVVKYHERFTFVRVSYRRDSEEAKKWGVPQAPTILVVEPAKKEVLEKSYGKKGAKDLKAMFARVVARQEKK